MRVAGSKLLFVIYNWPAFAPFSFSQSLVVLLLLYVLSFSSQHCYKLNQNKFLFSPLKRGGGALGLLVLCSPSPWLPVLSLAPLVKAADLFSLSHVAVQGAPVSHLSKSTHALFECKVFPVLHVTQRRTFSIRPAVCVHLKKGKQGVETHLHSVRVVGASAFSLFTNHTQTLLLLKVLRD
jgi:hypothetical protein